MNLSIDPTRIKQFYERHRSDYLQKRGSSDPSVWDESYKWSLLSKLTNQLNSFNEVASNNITGPYTLPEEKSMPDQILHICAGSGFVPNWSILKYCLRNYPQVYHRVLYSNKTWEDTIYRKELVALQKQYPKQLRITFTLTREKPFSTDEIDVRPGRIDQNMIAETLQEMDDPMIYVCGPAISIYEKRAAKKTGQELRPRFMESTLKNLELLGVDKKRIKRESYG